jgi:sialate O-acetylesterase
MEENNSSTAFMANAPSCLRDLPTAWARPQRYAMRRLLLSVILPAALLAGLNQHAHAEVHLPAVFGNHMVLQRDEPVPVWGWAEPGEQVTVQLDDMKAQAVKADERGSWRVLLPEMKVDGKAHKLKVRGENSIELDDILIGEVWLGSGQSNMEWSLRATLDTKEASHPSVIEAQKTIATANHPSIRLLHVPRQEAPEPARDFKASWSKCTPETIREFSAVLYYLGRRLHEELKVPVGLINSSWGGCNLSTAPESLICRPRPARVARDPCRP